MMQLLQRDASWIGLSCGRSLLMAESFLFWSKCNLDKYFNIVNSCERFVRAPQRCPDTVIPLNRVDYAWRTPFLSNITLPPIRVGPARCPPKDFKIPINRMEVENYAVMI
jgi:hypothetical protein